MTSIPTIKIVNKDNARGGFAIINETDFNSEIHELFEGENAPKSADDTPIEKDAEIGTDSGDQFSDKQLRDSIKAVTGVAPAGRTSRETLIKQFNELNAE